MHRKDDRVPDGAIPVGGRAFDDLKRLATTPYLLGIAGIIIIGQTIGAFMYNEQGKYIASLYATEVERAAMFANLEIAVNLLSLLFQAVVVTWLTRRGSVALSLSAMPALIGASFVVLALIPTGAVLLITQVIRRAADYGLGKPPREMLFTVLNPGEQVQEQEPDRHRPATWRGHRRPVGIQAGGRCRGRRHVLALRRTVRGTARRHAHAGPRL